jgi:NAD(P)-dependent dehydrogenase (short-subunit alcohol dehydrogenase family)
MRGLKGKRAIVTGGAQGIGRACVDQLVEYGCQVTISDLEGDTGLATQTELQAQGHDVHFIQGDMSDEEFCKEQVAFAAKEMGGIDFLVNNAFSFAAAGIDSSREQWNLVMSAGPIAFAAMTQEVAPRMEKAGGGAICNISSISAHIAQPGRWTYNSAKGAVDQLTKCTALDLAEIGVRVNSVSPGWIWTRAVLQAAGGDQEKYDPIWGEYHILGRCGLPAEVASAVMFLLSDEASFITGTDLPVDGGLMALGGEGTGKNSEFPDAD